ncbi:STAS-like domain-containing protein [Photobacterium leiognathi]|uniref:STAS-like domain-containing protein n=1 Tax=Photobacterium leiognathi TaxID=553611 RepID=UPI002739F550|nr:DUF4325 domain-containing protein [Photobacterium leiognathi]
MNVRPRTKKIRAQILRDVIHHPVDIAAHISEIFQISRQAVNNHLKALVKDDWLVTSGTTRNKTYKLGSQRRNAGIFPISDDLSEHSVYMNHFSWVVDGLPKNISDIIFYGFTEIFNNAIDHSEGECIYVSVHRTKEKVVIAIHDNGEGIFRRIKRLKMLPDERQSIVELSKGKLTTDPDNHSGQGIFFTSRMFDDFFIDSHEFAYGHRFDMEHDIMFDNRDSDEGTWVFMEISTTSDRVDKEVFEQFSDSDDDFAFNKTIIPVSLARFGDENLVSRSQAKRLLTRIEKFKIVLFDFDGVDEVGQAFADQIFRVYRNANPQISIEYTNASEDVEVWIKRAMSH